MKNKARKFKSIIHLEAGDCRWPIGDPKHPDFHFCGAHQVPGRPYCAHHWPLSFDAAKPLWGVPFAVKDNIDVAGHPTTAACPAYSYLARETAFAVRRLEEAGAILIGKTNLDQFATGLVGVRTPYPVPKNAIDPSLVPGGSSSGSAVAVAHGLVAFALGPWNTTISAAASAAVTSAVGSPESRRSCWKIHSSLIRRCRAQRS
mgnify:CR=1 FL=1